MHEPWNLFPSIYWHILTQEIAVLNSINSLPVIQWQFHYPCVALAFKCKPSPHFPSQSILLAYGTECDLLESCLQRRVHRTKISQTSVRILLTLLLKHYFVDLKYIHKPNLLSFHLLRLVFSGCQVFFYVSHFSKPLSPLCSPRNDTCPSVLLSPR